MGFLVTVEVSVKLLSVELNGSLNEQIKKELHGQSVSSEQVINVFKSDQLTDNVVSIRVCEITNNSGNDTDEMQDCSTVVLSEDFSINPYFFKLNDYSPEEESIGGDNDTMAANFLPLPSKCLDGLWESLVYDTKIKQELLQYSEAMLHYSRCEVDTNIINCNRVLLLHGPPGTGKTSLSKALAQKLSIRLNSNYHQALLIEINTHSLFSKYFSESGKLVSKMFGRIRELASDSRTLLCVLIDEVESLTHSRSASSNGSEPSDAIRVVNAVLTHLDILKSYPNVLTLTTSNVTNAIDIAFVDRADLCVHIPNPSIYGIYSILYSCLVELIRKKIVKGPFPDKILLRSQLEEEAATEQVTQDFITLCRSCIGFSGRLLRKLPLRVHSTIVRPEKCVDMPDFVKAMAQAAVNAKKELITFNSSNQIDGKLVED